MLFLLITRSFLFFFFFFFNDTATTEIYTLSLHDALPIFPLALKRAGLTLSDISLIEMHEAFAAQVLSTFHVLEQNGARSEEHTSELQSQSNLVCRLLLEKKKKK